MLSGDGSLIEWGQVLPVAFTGFDGRHVAVPLPSKREEIGGVAGVRVLLPSHWRWIVKTVTGSKRWRRVIDGPCPPPV